MDMTDMMEAYEQIEQPMPSPWTQSPPTVIDDHEDYKFWNDRKEEESQGPRVPQAQKYRQPEKRTSTIAQATSTASPTSIAKLTRNRPRQQQNGSTTLITADV